MYLLTRFLECILDPFAGSGSGMPRRDPHARQHVSHGRYEAALPRHLFADIFRLIAELRPPPVMSTA
jgi:hypothetical protein